MGAVLTLKLAWRNLGRNRKRTGLALAAIAVGQFAVVLYSGVMNGYADTVRQVVTGPFLGDVQVQHPRWRRERAPDLMIDDASALTGRLRADPLVVDATPVILNGCLAVAGVQKAQEAKPAVVAGVDPYGASSPRGLLAGVPRGELPGRGRVLVGRKLAAELRVAPGGAVDLIGATVDGFVAAETFAVSGLLATPVTEVDLRGIVMSLEDAGRFFDMPGRAHQIIIHARPGTDTVRLASDLAALAAAGGSPEVEVTSWRDSQPVLAAASDFMEYAHLIMLAVLIVAVVAGITNTMMTSVFERLREFGMLLGLGLRPRGIVRMLFAEAAVLGVMGAALGTSLGLAAVLGMAAGGGVDLMGLEKSGAEFAFGGIAMPSMVVPRVVVWNYVTGLVAVVATSLLSALWPASHAARLEPVEALRS